MPPACERAEGLAVGSVLGDFRLQVPGRAPVCRTCLPEAEADRGRAFGSSGLGPGLMAAGRKAAQYRQRRLYPQHSRNTRALVRGNTNVAKLSPVNTFSMERVSLSILKESLGGLRELIIQRYWESPPCCRTVFILAEGSAVPPEAVVFAALAKHATLDLLAFG